MQHLVGGISSAGRIVPDVNGRRFLVSKAQGPYVWDDQGRRYVDTALGFGATFLGHTDPEVAQAIHEAIDRGSMPAYAHALEEEAAASLASHTRNLTKVVFLNSGSEAVHLACRAAKAITGRRKIVKMAAGYDGWFDDVAFGNAGSREAAMASNERPSKGDTLLLRFNDKEDADLLFAECADIAAIILEPMMANAGCILAEAGYLQYVTALARKHGALVIMDEVLMGFRLHPGLASHLLGVEPDMATVGKAIGNGVAVAALLCSPELTAAFDDQRVNRAGTYNGNPLACAAVKAAMSVVDTVDYAAVLQAGNQLRERAVSAFAAEGISICTSGYGTVFTVWRGDKEPANYIEAVAVSDPGFTLKLHLELRRNGVMSMHSTYGRHYVSARHDEHALALWAEAFAGTAKQFAA
ncbi:aminotransferase class III-fold pyridoxal phosphate-dependent enzyme [Mesorhizobium sp. AR07]|uniref:aminotransferase class III-fold pyridoxal phosphate-dependent enzyme n=1 Tax=Mesorhizobium sp. AR07 TaxID=2865838 RepID=UPI0021600711|nr:aminotransferase class III-fold pyridoxal phosphate-dependent enzyme [Mesorhizobium sp. AR07]UVK43804.1 aminotransferase class III-fold pyridoxal phosphate-dependent enzyme [Mesorhizobium sp. AR07]